ncbi:isoprenylcysteine carboxyl methyltransferase family protein [Yinghuangia soli]|uniref:isoprenylcysteine carboxyl methyltransferase family protein n=1 Tax=Yinghuangia soli TaxID=2908204 RepID=UPI003556A29F
MSGSTWYTLLIAAVAVERLAELVVARRNAAWTLARGGIEYGRGHYPFMVALHTGLLAGCLLEPALADRPFVPALGWTMFALVLAAQALRWWCIRSLGPYWNTRVIVVPGAELVRRGPYRYPGVLRHPNYVAVAVEGAALPLVHSAWITAAVFTAANAALMVVRIGTENTALRTAATGHDARPAAAFDGAAPPAAAPDAGVRPVAAPDAGVRPSPGGAA